MSTISDLKKPCIAVSPFTNVIYVAGYDGTNWVCYKRLDDSDSFTLAGTIVAGTADTYGGLEVAVDSAGRLVFIVQAGDDLNIYESFDSGITWNTI